MARNAGISGAGWHSFGSSNIASRGEAGFVGARSTPAFDRGFHGWRGGWRGGWGRGGWGFGFGWPYWGLGWGFGWDPWWYNPYGYDPYWYSPYPAYNYYPDESYNWSDNPPPFRPDASLNPSDDNNSPASYSITPGAPDLAVSDPSAPTMDHQMDDPR